MKVDSEQIAKLYKDVPVEQVEPLREFRATYPTKHTTLDGVDSSSSGESSRRSA